MFKNIFSKLSGALGNATDPICGMKVTLEKTKYTSNYQGKVYGFCSENCKSEFDKNPEQYI